jgi:hypothetical protein
MIANKIKPCFKPLLRDIIRLALHKKSKSHPRQWVGCFRSSLQRTTRTAASKSHQRKLVDGSDPFLQRTTRTAAPKSHQRKLVDGSDPFYEKASKGMLAALRAVNLRGGFS